MDIHQDFLDFILFENIRCLDDIKHISADLATLSMIWQPCISVKIGGDQDFLDFILFDNIRWLDDIKHISADFPPLRGARAVCGPYLWNLGTFHTIPDKIAKERGVCGGENMFLIGKLLKPIS